MQEPHGWQSQVGPPVDEMRQQNSGEILGATGGTDWADFLALLVNFLLGSCELLSGAGKFIYNRCCWYSDTTSFLLSSVSVNSISSVQSSMYRCKKTFLHFFLESLQPWPSYQGVHAAKFLFQQGQMVTILGSGQIRRSYDGLIPYPCSPRTLFVHGSHQEEPSKWPKRHFFYLKSSILKQINKR